MSSKSKSVDNVKENIKLMKLISTLYGDIRSDKWVPAYIFPICSKQTRIETDKQILADIAEELNIKYDKDNHTVRELCNMINEKVGDYSVKTILSMRFEKIFSSIIKSINSSLYLQNTINIFHDIYSVPVFRTLMFTKEVNMQDIRYLSNDYKYKEADMLELLSSMLVVIKKIIYNLEKATKPNAKGFELMKIGTKLNPDFWYACTYNQRQIIVVLELINKLEVVEKNMYNLINKLLDDPNTRKSIVQKTDETNKNTTSLVNRNLREYVSNNISTTIINICMENIRNFIYGKPKSFWEYSIMK